MWWLIGGIICCSVALLTGAVIHEGNPSDEDDYMFEDKDPDEGDRS